LSKAVSLNHVISVQCSHFNRSVSAAPSGYFPYPHRVTSTHPFKTGVLPHEIRQRVRCIYCSSAASYIGTFCTYNAYVKRFVWSSLIVCVQEKSLSSSPCQLDKNPDICHGLSLPGGRFEIKKKHLPITKFKITLHVYDKHLCSLIQ